MSEKQGIGSMLKLGAVLAAFAGVACVLLALVNTATAPKIADLKDKSKIEALQGIFPDAVEFPDANFAKTKIDGIEIESICLAKNEAGKVIGAAVQANGPTYDRATILTGITTENTIKAIKILAISDTSGFGLNALKPDFAPRFEGKSLSDPFSAEKGGDVDGLSGATITRRGIAKILKVSTAKANELLSQVKGSAE